MRPKGFGGARAFAALALLNDGPHQLRRAAWHLPLRRSERGLLYFYHGLLSTQIIPPVELWRTGLPANPSAACLN